MVKNRLTTTKINNDTCLIEICLPDYIGLLAHVTGLLASYGISILKGQITTRDGLATDRLTVKLPKNFNLSLLTKDIDKMEGLIVKKQYDQIEKDITGRIIQHFRRLRRQAPQKLYPVQMSIHQDFSKDHTVVDIKGQDTPAFLHELAKSLALLKINIVKMEISTKKEYAHNRLWVVDQNQHKLKEKSKIQALQWAVLLVKQFTHILPYVPDPELALREMIIFSKEVIATESFEKVLITFKESRALTRLTNVFGSSKYLWEEFIRAQHGMINQILADEKLLSDRKEKEQMAGELAGLMRKARSIEQKAEIINQYKDQELFRIDLRHLLGKTLYLGDFAKEFSDLAEVIIDSTLNLAMHRTLKTYPQPMESKSDKSSVAVFAIGKFGGRELGYASDLELMFVYSDHHDSGGEQSQKNFTFYNKLVQNFKSIIQTRHEGVFEIDLRLRPYGTDGPMASSVGLFKEYFSHSGGAWSFERQALIKLRFVAGAEGVAKKVLKHRDQYVYSADPYDFQEAETLRKRQCEELVRSGHWNAKYSLGGLLDIEYLVQTLQIVYGYRSPDLQHSNTVTAIKALKDRDCISEEEAAEIQNAYYFFRNLINALRIFRGNAKDLNLPVKLSEEYLALGRRMGYRGEDREVRKNFTADLAYQQEMTKRLKNQIIKRIGNPEEKSKVRQMTVGADIKWDFATIFEEKTDLYRIEKNLRLIGFQDFVTASRQFRSLLSPRTKSEVRRRVVNASVQIFSRSPDPDMALFYLEHLMSTAPEKLNLWQAFVDYPEGFGHLLDLFGRSRYLAETMIEHPQYWRWIKNKRNYLMESKCPGASGRGRTFNLNTVRNYRHSQALRIALADIALARPYPETAARFSRLADRIIGRVFEHCFSKATSCVIGLGKLGGSELNFSSDIDLIFVADGNIKESTLTRSIEEFMRIMSAGPLNEFLFRVDLRLRPYGNDGSLYMRPGEYGAYYKNKADAWEYQMLIKARPVAGKIRLGKELIKNLQKYVYPKKLSSKNLSRIRKIKQKFENLCIEKKEYETNVKMGRGGIRDVEFTAQILQMKNGNDNPKLRNTNTLLTLEALRDSGALGENDAGKLAKNYIFLRRIEHQIQIFENRQAFNLPETPRDLKRIAKSLGYSDSTSGRAREDLKRDFKKCRDENREIFERIFHKKKVIT